MNILKLKGKLLHLRKIEIETRIIYESSQKEYKNLANNWLTNEAATLAETLYDGDACPVCGSEDHPDKAHREVRDCSYERSNLKLQIHRLANIESRLSDVAATYQSALKPVGAKKE